MLKDGLFTRFPRPDFALSLHDDDTMPSGTIGYHPGFFRAMSDARDDHRLRSWRTCRDAAQHRRSRRPRRAHRPGAADDRLAREQPRRSGRRSPSDRSTAARRPTSFPTKCGCSCRCGPTPQVRTRTLDAIRRIARGEADAAGAPREPLVDAPATASPPVFNDPALTSRLAAALKNALGDQTRRRDAREDDLGGFR